MLAISTLGCRGRRIAVSSRLHWTAWKVQGKPGPGETLSQLPCRNFPVFPKWLPSHSVLPLLLCCVCLAFHHRLHHMDVLHPPDQGPLSDFQLGNRPQIFKKLPHLFILLCVCMCVNAYHGKYGSPQLALSLHHVGPGNLGSSGLVASTFNTEPFRWHIPTDVCVNEWYDYLCA